MSNIGSNGWAKWVAGTILTILLLIISFLGGNLYGSGNINEVAGRINAVEIRQDLTEKSTNSTLIRIEESLKYMNVKIDKLSEGVR